MSVDAISEPGHVRTLAAVAKDMSMSRVTIELDASIAEALSLLDQPLDQAVRELIVLELYRRDVISSGRAAELLGMSKREFIQYSGRLGIPYFRLSEADLDAEAARIQSQ